MKRIWNTLKKYKYYTATLIVLLILSIIAGKSFNLDVGTPALIIFSLLGGLIILAFFSGVRNALKTDEDKTEAIIFGVFGIAFVVVSIWLIITKIL